MHELLAANPLLGAIDLFAGGDVLRSFSIVAVGLFPYLLAAGLVQLAAWIIPPLRAWREEADERRLKRATRAVTLPVALVVAWGLTRYLSLETGRFPADLAWFTRSDFASSLFVVVAMTAGAWVSEKIKDAITAHGIGSGESLILLVGSSLALVTWLSDVVFGGGTRTDIVRQLGLGAGVGLLVIALGVPLLAARRNIPMTIPRQPAPTPRFGRRHAPATSLPLPLNRGGTLPIASAVGFLLLFQIAAMALSWAFPGRLPGAEQLLLAPTRQEHGLYWALLAGLVVVFTYLNNFALLWKPFADSDRSLAEALRRNPQGGFIPGVRPGAATHVYLSRVMARITLPAAAMLALLAAGVPYLALVLTGENLAVAVLAELVFLKSFLDVRDRWRAHRTLDAGYADLLRKRS